MATTTNYGWETPDDTDLVKDGAAAIRTLGNSVDTTTKNLNPQTTLGDLAYRSATANVNTRLALGTANQVLRVNSGGTAPEWATTADQTPLTTKGDLFGFDTADARIPIGTNGHVLTADSTQALGLKWAAPAGGGKVLQVVAATESGWDQSATNTWIDNNLSATITPSATSSKVLVLVNLSGTGKANSDTWGEYRLLRGATTIITFEDRAGATGSTATSDVATTSTSYLDSPSTTSATTYKTQFRSGNNTNRAESGIAASTSTIVLMEIGA